jgi:hypothetical protein
LEVPDGNSTFSTIIVGGSKIWYELNSSNINGSLAEFAESVDTFDYGFNIIRNGVYSVRFLAGVDCQTGQSCTLRVGLTLNHSQIIMQSEMMFDTVDSDQIGQVLLIDFINLSVGDVVTFSMANWQNDKDIFVYSIYSTIQWISPPRVPLNGGRRKRMQL